MVAGPHGGPRAPIGRGGEDDVRKVEVHRRPGEVMFWQNKWQSHLPSRMLNSANPVYPAIIPAIAIVHLA